MFFFKYVPVLLIDTIHMYASDESYCIMPIFLCSYLADLSLINIVVSKGLFTWEATRVLGSEMEQQGVHMGSDS